MLKSESEPVADGATPSRGRSPYDNHSRCAMKKLLPKLWEDVGSNVNKMVKNLEQNNGLIEVVELQYGTKQRATTCVIKHAGKEVQLLYLIELK